MAEGGRTWKTWQLLLAAIASLVIGLAVGVNAGRSPTTTVAASSGTTSSTVLIDVPSSSTTAAPATTAASSTTRATTGIVSTTAATTPASGASIGDKVTIGRTGDTLQVFTFNAPAGGSGTATIDVQGCAGPQSTQFSINPLYFTLVMQDNTHANPALGSGPKPQLPATDLLPGECGRGYVSFTVPPGETPAAIRTDSLLANARWTIR